MQCIGDCELYVYGVRSMSFDQNLKYYCRAGQLYESCAAIQQKHRLCWATNEEAAKPATANRAPPAIAEGNLVFQTVNLADQTSVVSIL